MLRRLLLVCVLFLSATAQAGGYRSNANNYAYPDYCFSTVGEAVTYTYKRQALCQNGECRLLSYTPSTGQVQLIINSAVNTLSGINPCETVNGTSTAPATPWFGSDPGTVTACGSQVGATGGLTGQTGSTYVELTPEQKNALFKDGMDLGWMLAGACVAVWGLMMGARAFT